MKLEVGKTYRTRLAGHPVFIFAEIPGMEEPFIGVQELDDGTPEIIQFAENGHYNGKKESSLDLIGETNKRLSIEVYK